MEKLTPEQIAQRKAKNKATRERNRELFNNYLNQPIPKWTHSEKMTFAVAATIAVAVCIILVVILI